ncbi:uncharacterized protein ISCGN_029353 [Ixodes scapularis]
MYTTGKFLAILFVVVIAINDVAGTVRNQKPGAREAKMDRAEASGRSDMSSNVVEAQVVAAEADTGRPLAVAPTDNRAEAMEFSCHLSDASAGPGLNTRCVRVQLELFFSVTG